ncbi:hypothetical protein B0H16DRAFT_345001 [Mycena metata]|uniref:Transmembrane protein n=1 Tax=Mycena metata TaxID=1033252 RepID=A0AAD7HKN9_9AGAR|nr:hypothetical protein B0H16DRAFT_345001 [Mycena metata]
MSSTNFVACVAKIVSNETLWRTGGVDMHGKPATNVSQVLGMTYPMCVAQCGSAPEPFKFATFSNQATSFLLPFLALTAQFPFGGSSHTDNISTIMLTIGSPTLAVFSLVITVLNSRWIKRRFAQMPYYPNTQQAVTILNNLQESLLRVKSTTSDGRLHLLAPLIVLPENDKWWEHGAAALAFTHTWSMANIASVGWAIIAYIFTIACMDPSSMNIIGPAVACAWIWLLPLVVGWLQNSPNCDESQLRKHLTALNEMFYVSVPPPGYGPPVLADSLTEECAITVWPSLDNSHGSDEARSPPFFNYARVFPWARAVEQIAQAFEAASMRASNRMAVHGAWTASSVKRSIEPANRSGSANEVAGYIATQFELQPTCWAPEVWGRVVYSAIVACAVQWSCTGAAFVTAWMTPTVGLGVSFLLHGLMSTAVFIIILLGQVFEQFQHCTNPLTPPPIPPSSLRARYKTLSTLFRRVGKVFFAGAVAPLHAVNSPHCSS